MNKFATDTAIDSATALALIGITFCPLFITLAGGLLIPAVADVLQRQLSKAEISRIKKASILANDLIARELTKNTPLNKKNSDSPKLIEFIEGMLLSAKDSYEDKKIPLIANLFARTPFTNTPIENMLQALIDVESLSYRELAVLYVVGESGWNNDYFSIRPFFDYYKGGILPTEKVQGIYENLNRLVIKGLVGQIYGSQNEKQPGMLPMVLSQSTTVVPKYLSLLHAGRIIHHTMPLDFVASEDIDEIKLAFNDPTSLE